MKQALAVGALWVMLLFGGCMAPGTPAGGGGRGARAVGAVGRGDAGGQPVRFTGVWTGRKPWR